MDSKKKKRPIIQSIQTGDGRKVYLPPRKDITGDKQPLILRFVITGTIPSKKNLLIPSIDWRKLVRITREFKETRQSFSEFMIELRKIKPFIRHSKKFNDWEEVARLDILKQAIRWWSSYEKRNLVFPITKASVSIYHYWKDHYRRDNSNKLETINDVLVKAHIITDDTYQNLPKVTAEANVYEGEIHDHITIITVTAFSW